MVRSFTLVLTLFVAACSADRAPTMNLNLKKGNLGKPSLEALSGDCKVSSQVTDKVSVGTTLSLGIFGADCFREVFLKVSEDVFGRKVASSTTYNLADQSVAGTLDVGASAGGPSFKAKLNSKAANFVESVAMTSKGKGWRVTPTLHVEDLEVDMEVDTALGDSTEARFQMKHTGKASVDVFHALDAATTVKVSTGSGLDELKVALERRLGDRDTVVPHYDVKRRTASLDWTRKLGGGGGGQLTTTLSQATKRVKVALSGDGEGDWTAEVSAPWSNPLEADLVLGRKFNVGALQDFKLPFGGN